MSTNSFLSSPVIGLTWTGLDENDGVVGAGCCAKQTLGRIAESRTDEKAMKDWHDINVSFEDWQEVSLILHPFY